MATKKLYEIPVPIQDGAAIIVDQDGPAFTEVRQVDAEEVVRCKNCFWYQIRSWDDNGVIYDCRRKNGPVSMKEDDFCSYGKRKDE